MTAWERAKKLLTEGGHTCVLCSHSQMQASNERGVGFLLGLLDSQADVSGWYVADKVVGKGAAFLYVLLGVRAVYANVMSVAAREVLEKYGIQTEYAELPARIVNRTRTGFCPIESVVVDETLPQSALQKIRERIDTLKNTHTGYALNNIRGDKDEKENEKDDRIDRARQQESRHRKLGVEE